MSESRRTPEEKARIVIEFFETSITLADLCRKHGITLIPSASAGAKLFECIMSVFSRIIILRACLTVLVENLVLSEIPGFLLYIVNL